MKIGFLSLAVVMSTLIWSRADVPAVLTHQGRITVQSVNFDGTGQFKFALVNAAGDTTHWSNDGTSSGGSEPTDAVSLSVTKGLYAVSLGDTTLANMDTLTASVFNSDDVWLRVWFDDGVNGFQLLTPDQHLTSVPFAFRAGQADSIDGGSITNPSFIGNTAFSPLTFQIASQPVLQIKPTFDGPSLLAGYTGNSITAGVHGGTVFGGSGTLNSSFGQNSNQATGNHGTVSGGGSNTAGNSATVGGGRENSATGTGATIGGGFGNLAADVWSTIAGGSSNTAGGDYASIGGGSDNLASGNWSTIPGGSNNEATAYASFAAGQRAKSIHRGSFVWADSWPADFSSSADDQFNARASGGIRLFAETSSSHGLRLEYASRSSGTSSAINFVVGHALNGVDGDHVGAVVLGGGDDTATVGNRATGSFATISGGTANQATFGAVTSGGNTNTSGGISSAIGGGQQNSISSGGPFGTIGGGIQNEVAGWAASVAGGEAGTASGYRAAVGGGGSNTASGSHSTVPGGSTNTASGDYSFAAGRRAMAGNNGAFVWADSTDADFASNATDQFLIRASGGVGINTTDTSMAALTVNGTVKATALDVPSFLASGASFMLGTSDSNPVAIKVGDQEALVLAPVVDGSESAVNIEGGYFGNSITPGKIGATVFGGSSLYANQVTNSFGSVGGGLNNRAREYAATVGGGFGNDADGIQSTIGGGRDNDATDDYASIAGGRLNQATGQYSAVGGGSSNVASGDYGSISGGSGNQSTGTKSSILGGDSNTASGSFSTILGGLSNTASGLTSLAAGSQARALHNGAFVWSDSLPGTFDSTVANQFLIRAGGGVGINTSDTSAAMLTVGGGIQGTTFQAPGPNLTISNAGTGSVEIQIDSQSVMQIEDATDAALSQAGTNFRATRFGTITSGKTGSVVFGGTNTQPNSAIDSFATISGGYENEAGLKGFVGGGQRNQATGTESVIGGGFNNDATGEGSVVGGGSGNVASGIYATVPGGLFCLASGSTSLAAGVQAQASHDNSFIWSSGGYGFPVSTSTTKQFVVFASNGVGINTSTTTGSSFSVSGKTTLDGEVDIDGSVGVDGPLTSTGVISASSFNTTSDRNRKAHFESVSGEPILEKVLELPISSWSFKDEDASVRHVGPMAQDFRAAFGLGSDDKTIATVDADGIALAAIQGLNAKVDEHTDALSEENQRLREQNDLLQARLEKLEAVVETLID